MHHVQCNIMDLPCCLNLYLDIRIHHHSHIDQIVSNYNLKNTNQSKYHNYYLLCFGYLNYPMDLLLVPINMTHIRTFRNLVVQANKKQTKVHKLNKSNYTAKMINKLKNVKLQYTLSTTNKQQTNKKKTNSYKNK